jgi:2-polyprenyl-3-methyl-5-hydroxy-6-metoxy-1,4-benzoquinol methylase
MSQEPREYWDQKAPAYASNAGLRRFGRFMDLYEESCRHCIEPVLPAIEGSAILEAGCGTGSWVTRLAPVGYHVVLADLSPEPRFRTLTSE